MGLLVELDSEDLGQSRSFGSGANDRSVSMEGELLDSCCDGCQKKMLPNTQSIEGLQQVSQQYPSTIMQLWSNGVTKKVRF